MRVHFVKNVIKFEITFMLYVSALNNEVSLIMLILAQFTEYVRL